MTRFGSASWLRTSRIWFVALGAIATWANVGIAVDAQTPPVAQSGAQNASAGEPRLRALVVSGGCCHDYSAQNRLLVDAVRGALSVDWTVVIEGGMGTTGRQRVYESADWAAGYDLVIHNECFADNRDETMIRKIVEAHRKVPSVVVHCAMHTYRSAPAADLWREFLGVTSVRHTARHQITTRMAPDAGSIMAGFQPNWVTPVDELYVIDKLWPGARALMTAVSPEDQREYPLVWTNNYHGVRVFGTGLGHGNATWEDPAFQDLLVRGIRWAAGRAN